MEGSTPAPTPAQQQSLSHIIKAGWFLLELVNDTLDLAVIEVGKLSIAPATVAVDAMLQDCAAIIAPLAERRGLSVSFPAPDAAHQAYADPIRLQQVLLNLLSNSVKYNRDGGSITVRCSVAGERLRISVQDTGMGLVPLQLEHLFEQFNRLGQEGTDVAGTGIGLVLCKRLVELMGGCIGVDSVPGQGSDFWFELPLALARLDGDAGLEGAQPWQAPEDAQALPLVPLVHMASGHTVLHVDDNPANIELVEELLAHRPAHRLLTASHGALGFEFARAHRPAVILMDISLPCTYSTEALEMLQADPLTACIPVIALSANAMPHEIQHGLQAGFFRYVTKPIRLNAFLEALDAALLLAPHPAKDIAPPAIL